MLGVDLVHALQLSCGTLDHPELTDKVHGRRRVEDHRTARVLLVGYCSGPDGEPGCRSLIGTAGAGRRCANQTPAATSPTTGHSTTPVTARAPAARYTTGIGAPANACSATVTGASSTALSVAADEADAAALTAGPAAGVRADGVFGDAGMPGLFPQRGRATAPRCRHTRLAAKDPAGPAPLPVGPPSPPNTVASVTDPPRGGRTRHPEPRPAPAAASRPSRVIHRLAVVGVSWLV